MGKDSHRIGNVGEATAIADLTQLGYTICFPLTEDNPYDFVIEKDGQLSKVQVKACETYDERNKCWAIDLRKSYYTAKGNTKTVMDTTTFDYLYAWTPDARYFIPAEEVPSSRLTITASGKYSGYTI